MKELLFQLHDIEGLDPTHGWPLAIGWWVIIIIGILTITAMIALIISKIIFRYSWRGDALKKLKQLQTNLRPEIARETAVLLSEYLRRIVLQKFSRDECASLLGLEWLRWLKKHDPKQFDWEIEGLPLIQLPYAPVNKGSVDLNQLQKLIEATKKWVK